METLGPGTNWVQMFDGVQRRRLSASDRTYQMEALLDTGSVVPMHQHPHEQVSYVARGRLKFQIGEEVFEVTTGQSLAIPGGTPHGVWALEDSLAIDTFTPPRADYLEKDRETDAR
jgi:quercetin dioxygenase-like cupin family protein